MQIPSRFVRRGFTLLEVLLASAIGLLVLSGIYFAIDSQMRFAEEGRNLIDQATIARSLTARISSDIAPCAGMPDPSRYRTSSSSSSSSGSSGASGASGSSGSSGASGASGASGSSSSSSSSSSSQSSSGTTATASTAPDKLRVFIGSETSVQVFVTRVPRSIATGANPNSNGNLAANTSIESDQKVIFYWLAGAGSGQPLGLARYEMPLTTSTDGVPDVVGGADEAKYVIAPEVMALTFSYYDGSTWGPTWNPDGTQLSQDNQTPIGPPLAIRIKFELSRPGGKDNRKFEHVIAIPTANGSTTATTDQSQTQDP